MKGILAILCIALAKCSFWDIALVSDRPLTKVEKEVLNRKECALKTEGSSCLYRSMLSSSGEVGTCDPETITLADGTKAQILQCDQKYVQCTHDTFCPSSVYSVCCLDICCETGLVCNNSECEQPLTMLGIYIAIGGAVLGLFIIVIVMWRKKVLCFAEKRQWPTPPPLPRSISTLKDQPMIEDVEDVRRSEFTGGKMNYPSGVDQNQESFMGAAAMAQRGINASDVTRGTGNNFVTQTAT